MTSPAGRRWDRFPSFTSVTARNHACERVRLDGSVSSGSGDGVACFPAGFPGVRARVCTLVCLYFCELLTEYVALCNVLRSPSLPLIFVSGLSRMLRS